MSTVQTEIVRPQPDKPRIAGALSGVGHPQTGGRARRLGRHAAARLAGWRARRGRAARPPLSGRRPAAAPLPNIGQPHCGSPLRALAFHHDQGRFTAGIGRGPASRSSASCTRRRPRAGSPLRSSSSASAPRSSPGPTPNWTRPSPICPVRSPPRAPQAGRAGRRALGGVSGAGQPVHPAVRHPGGGRHLRPGDRGHGGVGRADGRGDGVGRPAASAARAMGVQPPAPALRAASPRRAPQLLGLIAPAAQPPDDAVHLKRRAVDRAPVQVAGAL